MSVLLEGTIPENSEPIEWNGVWQFVRDRSAKVQFKYTHASCDIPNDLINYVSFRGGVNTVTDGSYTEAGTAVTSRLKPRKKGRGRGKKTEASNVIATAAENAEMDVDATSGETGDADEQEVGGTDDDEQNQSTSANATTTIKRTHRLFGYYEGTFDVKSGPDMPDTSVPESFFIYTVAALPPLPATLEAETEGNCSSDSNSNTALSELDSSSVSDNRVILSRAGHSLPPEQIFSYSVIKILKEEFSESQEPKKEKRLYKTALHNASARAAAASANATSSTAAATTAVGAVETEVVDLSAAKGTSSSSSSSSSDNSGTRELSVDTEGTGGAVSGTSSSTSSSSSSSSSSSASGGSSKLVDCAAVQVESLPSHFTLVLGFGRNMFGRFALIGAYNELTRFFVCEKRYMVSKHTGINRYRLPIVTTSRYAEENEEGAGEEGAGGDTGGGGFLGRRKRTSTSRLFFEDMESPGEQGAWGLGGNTPKHKKGKGYHSGKATEGEDADDLNDTDAGGAGDLQSILAGRGYKKIHGNCKSLKERHHGLTQVQLAKQNELRAVYDRYLPDDITCESMPNMAENGFFNDAGEVVSTYKSATLDPDTGDIYEGGWIDGYRHGRGVCLYALPSSSESVELEPTYYMYEGDWQRGKEHGQGVYMTGNREIIYEGEFVDGIKQGYGTYHFSNGDTYTGDFKEGVRHGKGTYLFADNLGSYEGDWRDDRRHGRGVFTWFNKNDEIIDGKLFQSTYNGDWEYNQRHGRGVLLLTNGFYYDGHWDRGIMEGKGECIYPIPESSKDTNASSSNGSGDGGSLPPTPSRSGSISHAPSPRASPKTLKRTSSGSSLGGNGNINIKSKGKEREKETEIPIVQQLYQGSFRAGLRDGRGTIVFAEGAEYEGRFRDDRLDGHAGTMKITKTVPGTGPTEVMIPVTLQADIKRIHYIAGFGEGTGH